MKMLCLKHFGLILLLVFMDSVNSHRGHHGNHGNNNNEPGQPLYLTPLIKKGKIEDARSAASVPCANLPRLKSYSGYLTVNEQYGSNMFFWYFPSKVNPETSPIVVWLEGGPGASSLFGLFIENGPFELTDSGNVKLREYSWNNKFNLIYVDNPVGAGYSFTENDDGYAKNEEDVGRDLYEAVKQLYKIFPEFGPLPFYITGSSYAGKFVPALAYKIHKENMEGQKAGERRSLVNLAGLAIGNGFVDPITQIDYGDNLYGLGLIDEAGLEEFKRAEAAIHLCIEKKDIACVRAVTTRLHTNEQGSTIGTTFGNLTGFTNMFDFAVADFNLKPFLTMRSFVQRPNIRKSIHVGNNSFYHLDGTGKVEQFLLNDLIDSVAPWLAELLNHYRVCIYHGQTDLLITYWPTVRYLQNLKFNGAEEYKSAKRQVWRVDNEVAGYVKQGGNLLEVLVRNAGHLATTDQPKWTFDMINRFVSNQKFALQ